MITSGIQLPSETDSTDAKIAKLTVFCMILIGEIDELRNEIGYLRTNEDDYD